MATDNDPQGAIAPILISRFHPYIFGLAIDAIAFADRLPHRDRCDRDRMR